MRCSEMNRETCTERGLIFKNQEDFSHFLGLIRVVLVEGWRGGRNYRVNPRHSGFPPVKKLSAPFSI